MRPKNSSTRFPVLKTRRGISTEYRWAIEGAAEKLDGLSNSELAAAISDPKNSPHIKAVHYLEAAELVMVERMGLAVAS